MKRQKIMVFSTLPIIAGTTIINHGYRCLLPLSFILKYQKFLVFNFAVGGIVYTVGYAIKIPHPGSRGASIIATVGPALVLYGLLMRLFIIQSTRSKGTTGRFLKLTSIDFFVLGAVMWVLTNAVYIVGIRPPSHTLLA